MGKTAASIKFVGDAGSFIETSKNEEDKKKLVEAIEKIKKGELSLDQFITPEDFLLLS